VNRKKQLRLLVNQRKTNHRVNSIRGERKTQTGRRKGFDLIAEKELIMAEHAGTRTKEETAGHLAKSGRRIPN